MSIYIIILIIVFFLCVVYIDHRLETEIIEHMYPTPRIIMEVCDKIGVPYTIVSEKEIIIGTNYEIKFVGSISNLNSRQGVLLAINKRKCSKLLADLDISVPKFQAYPGLKSEEDIDKIINNFKIDYPLVVKPVCGQSGIHVYVGIKNETNLRNILRNYINLHHKNIKCDEMMIEEFVEGDNYRFLFYNGYLLDVVKRGIPYVKGNGESTLKELIDEWNVYRKKNRLKPMQVDWKYLNENGTTKSTIIPDGINFIVKQICGSCVFDHIKYNPKFVHPSYIKEYEKVGKIMHLKLYGLDVIATDLSKLGNAKINEVNSAPSMRIHYYRNYGYLDVRVDLDVPTRLIKLIQKIDF